jgi:hypothetical protein
MLSLQQAAVGLTICLANGSFGVNHASNSSLMAGATQSGKLWTSSDADILLPSPAGSASSSS